MITLIINVEAQKTQRASTLGYDILKRALYYVSRIISSQKEREFEGSDYNSIKKSTAFSSVWIPPTAKAPSTATG